MDGVNPCRGCLVGGDEFLGAGAECQGRIAGCRGCQRINAEDRAAGRPRDVAAADAALARNRPHRNQDPIGHGKVVHGRPKVATHIVTTYKLVTPDGRIRRTVESLPIDAPSPSAAYFRTALGNGRVEEILRTKGLSLAEAQATGGIRALPGLPRRWSRASPAAPIVDHIEAL